MTTVDEHYREAQPDRRNRSALGGAVLVGALLGLVLGVAAPGIGNVAGADIGAALGGVVGALVGRMLAARVTPEEWDPGPGTTERPHVGAHTPDDDATAEPGALPPNRHR